MISFSPVLAVAGLLSPLVAAWPALRFTEDGTFQITVFNDLHFGEAEDTLWGPKQDVDTLKVMRSVLGKESPQLVVVNGDWITGENTFKENSTDYVDMIVKPFVEAGLPWASTYGNHDSDYNLSRSRLFAREKQYENSLTERMVPSCDAGVSNYYIEVFPADTKATTPALLLWFFDSRGGNYYQKEEADGTSVGQPNWVANATVDWFRETRDGLIAAHGRAVPSLAFVHIPVDAFLAFQEADGGVNAYREPGINADKPLSQQGSQSGAGNSKTVFTYDGQDMPFMAALLETKNLKAVVSGHDHGNDWCFRWEGKLAGLENLTGDGLDLCFGRHTGYGGYGSWTRGSRQIFLDLESLDDAVDTWTRLEDGTVTGSVTLNATFGEDVYPKVPLTYTSE